MWCIPDSTDHTEAGGSQRVSDRCQKPLPDMSIKHLAAKPWLQSRAGSAGRHMQPFAKTLSDNGSVCIAFSLPAVSVSYRLQVSYVKLRGDWAGKISLHVQHRWDAVSFVFGNMSRSQRAQWQTLDSLTLWGIHLFSFCWRVSCWWEGGYCYLWTEQDESFLVG